MSVPLATTIVAKQWGGIMPNRVLMACRAAICAAAIGLGVALAGDAVAKPEGTINIGLASPGGGNWMVPARAQSDTTAIIPVFNTLLERDDKTGQPAPGLAVKWEQSSDGKT